ncbi:unnamed protein product [Camellia sinensis]
MVPCEVNIAKMKKESSTVSHNKSIYENLLPTSCNVKSRTNVSCQDACFQRADQPAVTVTASSGMDVSPSKSDGGSVSLDETMSTCDFLRSPEFEYIDNDDALAVNSIERKACSSLDISDPEGIAGNICKRDILVEIKTVDRVVGIDDNVTDPQLRATIACEIYKNLQASERGDFGAAKVLKSGCGHRNGGGGAVAVAECKGCSVTVARKKMPRTDLVERIQGDINASMRAVLIDWLVEVAEEYSLVPETLFLTVNYIDRYLSGNVIQRQRLQLLGYDNAASKYEEICAPQVEEFCYVADNTYFKKEVLQMESSVLNYLKFEMSAPTAGCFLTWFVRAAQGINETMLCYAPSLIAASAIFLTLTLRHCTLYKPSDLRDCVKAIHRLFCNIHSSSLPGIREKYSQHKTSVTCHIDMEPNNHENDGGQCDWKPRVRMTFDTEQEVYDFYNSYGGRLGFSIRRGYVNKSKEGQITSRQFVCNKEGFRVVDKRDSLTKNPRQEVRTGCQARLVIKWDRNIQKFFVSDFVEQHNHIFVPTECTHMLPSQRKISASQATEIDLAEKSGIRLNAAFELMGNEVGGRESLGFTKLDQKNYLRTKRQNSLAYGEAGSILQYFRDKSLENPSFFYSVQLDNEEQITNIFWADAQMIMDYGQFGDVVTFDTTYKLNSAHRPFASFVGFNHHRETVIFGAALMYDETADSFVWLFRRFLEAMSSKAPKTIFTDQDAAMAKAIPVVMPNTTHRLCTWHLMQNALRHANSIFKDKATVKDKGIKSVLSTFMYDIEDEEEFTLKWEEMLDKYEVRDNHWLKLTFGVKEKWGWPYVRNAWGAGMSITQLSESFNAFLKDFIQSDHNLMQFFMHFDRVLSEKRYKELQAEYALCQKLPRVNIKVKIMEQAADVYTNKIFEEFQDEYVKSLEVNIEEIENDGDSTVYTVLDSDGIKVRKVRQECDDLVTCSCRKFEMKGILCSHCLKILRERLKFKEIPSQYILKRWTKKARSENVKDRCGHDIQVDVRLHQTSRYRSLMAIFRSVACRASESEETYNLTVEKADELIADIETMLSAKFNMPCSDTIQESPPESFEVDGVADNNVVQAKGLKRRECTSKGRRRIKGGLELALAKKNKTSSYNASQTSMSVTPQTPPLFSASAPEAPPLFHQSAPLFSSAPQLPPFSPSVPEVRVSSSQFMYPAYDPSFPHHNMHFSMPSMYSVHGTYQALLNNASSYHSQASNSPACSEVLYARGRGRGRGPFHPIALMHLNNIASWQGIKVAVKKLGEEVTADEDKEGFQR